MMTTTQVGYGKHVTGGDRGDVIAVTTTAASGPGSLRSAWTASGPRRIVVETDGVVVLGSACRTANGNVTLDINGRQFFWRNSPLIAEGCLGVKVLGGRARIGNLMPGMNLNERGALHMRGVVGFYLDRFSGAYGVDGTIQIYDGCTDGTIAHALLTLPLYRGGHPDGVHAMALVVSAGTGGAPCERITFYRGLSQHSNARGCRLLNVHDFELLEWTFHDFGDDQYPAEWSKVIELDGYGNGLLANRGTIAGCIYLARPGGPSLFKLYAPRPGALPQEIRVACNVDGDGRSLDADWLVEPGASLEDVLTGDPVGLITAWRHPGESKRAVAETLKKRANAWGAAPRDALDAMAVSDMLARQHRAIDSQAEFAGAEGFDDLGFPEVP